MSSDQHASALPTSVTAGRHGAVGAELHHDDHAFDDTPASALPLDEPRTPGWLPVVGLALLLAALVVILASGDEAPRSPAAASEPAQAAEAAEDRPANPPTPAVRAPAGLAASALAQPRPPRTPEQRQELQKRIDEARAKQVVQPPASPPPTH